MKKSVEILSLPVISITEGRELGMSKSLLIDAKNGAIAAITIEDEDWYRGVKLLPYTSVIAIGNDAVTVTSSESILTLEDAGDFEAMLDANIKIIGTKAITKSGTIQGKVTEIFVGETGRIEKCEIESADGSLSEIAADQVSIFGKEVTVIDSDTEKKTESLVVKPAPEKAPPQAAVKTEPANEATKAEPVEAEIAEPEPVKVEAPMAEEAEEEETPEAEPVTIENPKQEEIPVAEEPKVEEAPKAEPVNVEVAQAEESKQEEAPKEEPKVEEAPKAEPAKPATQAQSLAEKAVEERHRRFLLGKKVTRKIAMDNGLVIADAGATVTEEILQKAKLSNKFVELSMNVQ